VNTPAKISPDDKKASEVHSMIPLLSGFVHKKNNTITMAGMSRSIRGMFVDFFMMA
jgi:hypothetical protein